MLHFSSKSRFTWIIPRAISFGHQGFIFYSSNYIKLAMNSRDLSYSDCLSSEVHTWYMRGNIQQYYPHFLPLYILLYSTFLQFILIKCLMILLSTFPVTSCTAERSFSTLKLIKSSLLLYVHRDTLLDNEKVLDEFCRHHTGHLQITFS